MKNPALTFVCLSFLAFAHLSAQTTPAHLWTHAAGANIPFAPFLAADNTGNVYACSVFMSTVDFDPGAGVTNLTSAGNQDVYIQKMDAAGTFVWACSFGNTANDEVAAFSTDGNGNCYVTGMFSGTVDFDPGASVFNLTSNGLSDYYVVKLNSSGVFQWAQSGGSSSSSDGGIGIDTDPSGNVFVTGSIFGVVDMDAGSGTSNAGQANTISLFLMKLDPAGNFVWAKANSAGTQASFGTSFNSSVVADGTNIYVLGYFSGTVDFDPGAGTQNLTSLGQSDIFVQKFDSNGNMLWIASEGGTGDDRAFNFGQDAAGSLFICGYFSQSVDFDMTTAGTHTLTTSFPHTYFIQKIDGNSNLQWVKAIDLASDVLGAAVDANGNVAIAGYFIQTADLDPGAGVVNATSAGLTDYCITVLDNSGNFVWARHMGSAGDDGATFITSDSQSNLLVSGFFTGTVDFDPNAGVSTVTSSPSSQSNSFVHKLAQLGTGVAESNLTLVTLNSFPNPSTGTVSVQSTEAVACSIISGTGATVAAFTLNSSNSYSHSETLSASGVYILYAVTEDGRTTAQKIVVSGR